MPTDDPVATYYRTLDDHDYETLRSVLSRSFVQHRPDRTFEDRESFVRFMRDDRPSSETTHELDGRFRREDDESEAGSTVLVRGRVRNGEETLLRFVDAFTLADGHIERVETYTR
ncbi:nuclear transport factor 2 family protein [Haloarchaeobius litoreus]|uniref:Nuclear transport factor 2 family protein n=1 Tax=Haloarchaeobius litoreus TaxID=755306 RepID=A0ABD6DNR2_9EURY|nr:nuclear transport factor 2 family protein [Haloarchaeobius litoreus]